MKQMTSSCFDIANCCQRDICYSFKPCDCVLKQVMMNTLLYVFTDKSDDEAKTSVTLNDDGRYSCYL